jgi:hypothetical protein
MKKILFISLIFVLAASACEKQEYKIGTPAPPDIAADCSPEGTDFRFTYSRYVIERDDYFFIKGKVLNIIPYGINVNLIEDLKGNFSSDFPVIIWFGGDAGLSSTTSGDNQYNPNDTLLIVCQSAAGYGQEYIHDMAMLPCSPSALKVSGEYVSGCIYDPYRKDTVLWNKLKSQLNVPR